MHGHGDALAGDKQQTESQPRKFKLWAVPGVARGQCPLKEARPTGTRDQGSDALQKERPGPRAHATRASCPAKEATRHTGTRGQLFCKCGD